MTFPRYLLLFLVIFSLLNCGRDPINVLVYSSADQGYEAEQFYNSLIDKLSDYNLSRTDDPDALSEQNLKAYDAVIFTGVNGDQLNAYQRADLERYVQAGGNFIGINALSNTDRHWLWYGKLTGAFHSDEMNSTEKQLQITDPGKDWVSGMVEDFSTSSEWPVAKLTMVKKPLLQLQPENGDNIPVSWQHAFDDGQSWQIVLPTDNQLIETSMLVDHLKKGLANLVKDTRLDYNKATTDRVPEENRFTKRVLASNLFEPMELDVLPDGKVLVVERRGGIFQYDPEGESFDTVAIMPVHTEFEDGLMGIAVDPDYEDNHWIYLYYSPVGDEPKQHLSRFEFQDGKVDFESEKVVLVVGTQRDECCHSGGSLEFGPDGLLYLSTGDDTNPFDSDGFSPIDERPGRSPWDAQKSSANTNDLRGKILRIKPEDDGTYSIPEGNLFPEGTADTRPEIHVMGCRNPFRISVDSRTNFLYWGDVGPDSGKDDPDRGPRGIDEINQARQAGFWGWPYTRGNNIVYHDFDFAQQTPGKAFDPENLINDSPNNTGLKKLPPAQKSMVWYGYGESAEFPWVAKGGKNPMAGPVYYSEDYEGEHKFPEYFDGKLIAYEWMRHWIYVITMDESHNFVKAEPFMPNTRFSRPMDMVFDKNGKLYVLEYGQKWFAQNEDARLSVIEYNGGNRAPIAQISTAQRYGATPFNVKISASESSDYDGDPLSYEWTIDGQPVGGNAEILEAALEDDGAYEVAVKVTDPAGASSTANLTVYAGNQAPVVKWNIEGNRSFFWPGRQIDYKVEVKDKEDGSEIKEERLNIAFDYLPIGEDLTMIAQGHAAQMTGAQIAMGKALIGESDCKVCHAIDKKIAGPSYQEIAKRYEGKEDALDYLSGKIIKGGGGVWGETVMAAHPDLTKEEAVAMATYVLSVSDIAGGEKEKMPKSGKYNLDGSDETGQYILWSSYTDGGSETIEPITAEDQVKLRYHKLQAEQSDKRSKSVEIDDFKGANYLSGFRHGDYFVFNNIDLTDVEGVVVKMRCGNAGGALELRLGGLDKPVIAAAPVDCGGAETAEFRLAFEAVSGFQDLYFRTTNEQAKAEWIGAVDWVEFLFAEAQQDEKVTR